MNPTQPNPTIPVTPQPQTQPTPPTSMPQAQTQPQPQTTQPGAPIKQTQVELATGINIFSGTPGLLEWTADNRIRLYTSQAGQWMLVFDIAPSDIGFAAYTNGALSLSPRQTLGLPQKNYYIIIDKGATVSNLAEMGARQFGLIGAVASATILPKVANRESATDAGWWIQTLTNFGVMKPGNASTMKRGRNWSMIYIIASIIGSIILIILIIFITIGVLNR